MSAASDYDAHLFRDFSEVAPLLTQLAERQGALLPFQDMRWLSLWYEHFTRTGVKPLVVVVTGRGHKPVLDNVAMAFPLVRRRKYLLPVVEFADRSVTDYNMPLEGPCCPTNPVEMRELVSVLQRAVRPYALFRLTKMPREVRGKLNPFAMLEDIQPSGLEAHYVTLPGESGALMRDLPKKKRVEIGRVGRILDSMGDNRFGVAETVEERAAVFALICEAQRARVPGKNERYFLEDPGYREFYDALVLDPASAGLSVVSAIWLDGRPIAGVLGVRRGDRYVALRIGVKNSPEIMRLGLGKVLLLRTAEWATDQGLKIFDLSLGGNALKAWFHPDPFALIQYGSLFNGIHLPKWLLGLLPAHQLAGHGEAESLPGRS